jgi:hypothetical protein
MIETDPFVELNFRFLFYFLRSIAEFEQFLGMRKEIEAEDEEFEF